MKPKFLALPAMSRARRRAVLGALSGLVIVAVGAGPATADSSLLATPGLDLSGLSGLLLDLPGDLVTWTKGQATPLLQVTDAAPGQSADSVVGVGNQTDEPVRMSLTALSVREDDGVCVEAESQAGDDSCGSGDGELGPYLRVVINRDPERDGSFEAQPVFSGTLEELTEGTPLAEVVLPAFSAWDYRVELAVAPEAGNEVMGDRVSFDLAWTSTTSGGEKETIVVPATDTGVPPPPSLVEGIVKPATDALGTLFVLPVTGSGLGLGLQALGLVAFGLLLRIGTRRRNDPSTSDPEGN